MTALGKRSRLLGVLAAATCLAVSGTLAGEAEQYKPSAEAIRQAGSGPFFEGKSPEQIAPYLAHPHPIPSSAAARALGLYRDAALPFIKRLLGDTHAGTRMGALKALQFGYGRKADGPMWDTVPPAVQDVLTAVVPLAGDPDPWVRRGVLDLVRSLRVENAEIHKILYRLAGDGHVGVRAAVCDLMRFDMKDPAARVRIGIINNVATNRAETRTPADYRLLRPANAHIEECRAAIPVVLDFLRRHGQGLYGMWADRPRVTAMKVLSHYHDDPRVAAALPLLMERYTLGGSREWYGPTRTILLKIGPKALPALRAFLATGKQRLGRGDVDADVDWSAVRYSYPRRLRELAAVAEMIPLVHGRARPEGARAICRAYVMSWWSRSERALLREALLRIGPAGAGEIRKATKGLAADADTSLAAAAEALEAGRAEGLSKAEGRALAGEKAHIQKHRWQLGRVADELKDVASLAELLAADRLGAKQVESLCRIYRRRIAWDDVIFEPAKLGWIPWPDNWEPWPEVARIRAKLRQGGAGAAPAIRAFIESEKAYRRQRAAYYDDREAFFRGCHVVRFGRGLDGTLIQLDYARADLIDAYAQLTDLALVLEIQGGRKPTAADLAVLCRIYTRRPWPGERKIIDAVLKAQGASAAKRIADHIAAEKAYRVGVVRPNRHAQYANMARARFIWMHDRWRALGQAIDSGIAGLARQR